MTITLCRSCRAPMVFLKTSSGKLMPINADSVREGDTIFDSDVHVSHYATCPQAKQWSKKNPKPKKEHHAEKS